MGGACNRILCNGSLAPWHQGLGLEEREIPGTGPQERLDLPLLGVEGPGSVFSPPLPILPLGDSCMGGGGGSRRPYPWFSPHPRTSGNPVMTRVSAHPFLVSCVSFSWTWAKGVYRKVVCLSVKWSSESGDKRNVFALACVYTGVSYMGL